ncbi:50S ribosomal protein L11 [Methanocella sp. CWC-04]|uniref:Large ribosomal subunit protein uL11 n=1 Tax=Methanooceanicella nereidis TaxID=2052831 RepID=A0AAP2RFA4_9EURY|nr:50S ribosomal protein L11 [Methanocella sp. CWC-04]MCD1296319.1 50S ribosomal protein L11 [Methanocella sp. CWC-04]
MADVVEVLVPGGKANPGPPLGPSLGPLGINIKKVVDEINAKTASFNGMTVPVKISVDAKKNFTVEVGTPPTSALILSELKLTKGSGATGTNFVGDLTIDQAARIAEMKKEEMLSYNLKGAVKEVIGTCVSMGITVEGKKPKEIFADIDAGKYDDKLSKPYK